jgi:DNA polymerase-3 subunit epsilon/ATP-dependent DNA helicase DinG
MVRHSPGFNDIREKIESLTRQAYIVGHSVIVDMAFLNKQHLLLGAPIIDTYDLSCILLPTQKKYSLKSLGAALQLPGKNSHRALDDARLAYLLFEHLYNKALTLPDEIFLQMTRIGQNIDWSIPHFIEVIRSDRCGEAKQNYLDRDYNLKLKLAEKRPPKKPISEIHMPDVYQAISSEVNEILSFQDKSLLEAENRDDYLLSIYASSVVWSRKTGNQTWLVLQDYHSQKFIYDRLIQSSALEGLPEAIEFHEKIQYLCPQRLQFWMNRASSSVEQARLLAKVLVWLEETDTFLRYELNISNYIEQIAWRYISWNDYSCHPSGCPYYAEKLCLGQLAREKLSEVPIVFTNVQDMVNSPDICELSVTMVIHDTWNIIEDITYYRKERYTLPELTFIINQMICICSELTAQYPAWLSENREIRLQRANALIEDYSTVKKKLIALFELLCLFFLVHQKKINYDAFRQHIRVTRGLRMRPDWSEVIQSWSAVSNPIKNIIRTITDCLLEAQAGIPESCKPLSKELESQKQLLISYSSKFEEFLLTDSPQYQYYGDVQTDGNGVILSAYPINPADILKDVLQNKKGVLFLSPTLKIMQSLDYIKKKLPMDIGHFVSFDSHPVWRNEVLLYWVNNMPDSDDPVKYLSVLEYAIEQICEYIMDNTLFLFNAPGPMHQILSKIGNLLTIQGVEVIELDRLNNRIEGINRNGKAVRKAIFCTYDELRKTFIPTCSFSLVVFTKLPFQDLSDPYAQSQIEKYKDPFNEFSLPEAIRSFKYAFQFLDHQNSHKSGALLLDPRIRSKEYGKLFINDLPLCSVSSGNLMHFIKTHLDWIANKKI